MADRELTAQSALGNYVQDWTGITLKELSNQSLVSVAAAIDDPTMADKLTAGFGCAWPSPGQSILSTDEKFRLIGMQRDQLLILFDRDGLNPVAEIAALLDGAGYYTDQSDAWVMLEIDGPDSRQALERICAINLHPDRFAIHASARTVMEHLGTVIVRTGPDRFLLMSARSSARSFLHALETSVAYTR